MDLISRLTRIDRGELPSVLWAATLFFFLLCSYYILRPMREAMGIAGGTRQLPNLYLVTLTVTLLATPVFGWMTRRYDKRKFLPYTYRFFAANLLLFLVASKLLPESSLLWLGRVFYVWISVFNMFLISLFWAFMADGFGLAQSKRLFGSIAVGGSLGAAFGAGITRFFISIIGQNWLVLVSIVLLEVAVRVVHRLQLRFDAMGPPPDAPPELPKERPSVWEGLQLTLRSPYLGGIALFLFFYSSSSTFLYFTQAEIVAAAETARNARVERFADIDLYVNIAAVTLQLFVTGRIMTRLGVSVASGHPASLDRHRFCHPRRGTHHDRAHLLPGLPPRGELRGDASRPRNPLHRARHRGEVQSQVLPGHLRLSRGRRGLGQGLRRPAGAGSGPDRRRGHRRPSGLRVGGRRHLPGPQAEGPRQGGIMSLNRRKFLRGATLGGAALGLGGLAVCQAQDVSAQDQSSPHDCRRLPEQKLRILILGGTAFLGPAIVRAARRRGHEITLFNRGRTNADLFPDIETIIGDRDGGLAGLEGRQWDCVVDTSGYVPRIVNDSAQLLKNEAGLYCFISTVSVYERFDEPGIDESFPVGVLEDERVEVVDGDTYGPLKALCEQAAEAAFPGRCLVIRPGLIVGEMDRSDRFTYWPVRVSKGGEVLAPNSPQDGIQIIDVNDLGEWTIYCLEQNIIGVYNAISPPGFLNMGGLLGSCQAVSGSDADFVWADTGFLEEHEVEGWMEMTCWMPPVGEYAGFNEINVDAALAKGLTIRPISETVRDTLDWWNTLPAERRENLRAGLAAEKEELVLAAWHEAHAGG